MKHVVGSTLKAQEWSLNVNVFKCFGHGYVTVSWHLDTYKSENTNNTKKLKYFCVYLSIFCTFGFEEHFSNVCALILTLLLCFTICSVCSYVAYFHYVCAFAFVCILSFGPTCVLVTVLIKVFSGLLPVIFTHTVLYIPYPWLCGQGNCVCMLGNTIYKLIEQITEYI